MTNLLDQLHQETCIKYPSPNTFSLFTAMCTKTCSS